MLLALIDGFLLGGSLIVAIGAQNAFVIRQGLVGRFVFWVCLFCALADAVLIVVGVSGIGLLVAQWPALVPVMTYAGAVYLAWFGVLAVRRVLFPVTDQTQAHETETLSAALLQCAAFTLLNPHVYLDTVILLGGLANARPLDERDLFAFGAATASFVWFFSIGFGAMMFKPMLDRPSVWRLIDAAIAVIMFSLSIKFLIA